MADRIKNYAQEASQINTLKSIRSTLDVTPSTYTPDTSVVTKDRVATFAQAEEELTVLGDIDLGMKRLKGDVDVNAGDIANIKALLKGQLYDYQTDSTSAYTKSVPAGAMPYAGIEKVGGKTIVMNQGIPIVNSDNWQSDNTNYATFSAVDGVGTLEIIQDSGAWYQYAATVQQAQRTATLIQGHKYYCSVESMSDYVVRFLPFSSNYDISITIPASTVWTRGSQIATASVNWPTTYCRFMFVYNAGTIEIGKKLKFRNPIFVDLTLMFGAGNEPTTTAEFEAMFPGGFYAKNSGTLLSAGVTSVLADRKNLAYCGLGAGTPSDTTNVNTAKRKFPLGKYIVGMSGTNLYNPTIPSNITVTDNSITFQAWNVGYGIGIPFRVGSATSFTVSCSSPESISISVAFYGADGTYLGQRETSGTVPFTATTFTGAVQGLVVLKATTASTLITYTNIQIERGSNATEYSSPVPIDYPIPTAIRNLEGYGWSAGTASNYIDFERKKFVKCVDRVDIGTLSASWGSWSNPGSGYFILAGSALSNALPNFYTALSADNSKTGNIVYEKYATVPWTNAGTDKSVAFGAGGFGQTLEFRDTDYTNTNTWLSAVAGAYLYYQMATPTETDISEYITDDNLIEVEANGTLTFPNSNGADYCIPVPSEEEYMIDLQEA